MALVSGDHAFYTFHAFYESHLVGAKGSITISDLKNFTKPREKKVTGSNNQLA